MRAGLGLPEEKEKKIIVLRHAIDEDINCGLADDFEQEEHLKV